MEIRGRCGSDSVTVTAVADGRLSSDDLSSALDDKDLALMDSVVTAVSWMNICSRLTTPPSPCIVSR